MSDIITLSPEQARRALLLRDLTDPEQGRHAMQLVVDAVESAVHAQFGVKVVRRRANPVVTVADNYDRLGYPGGAATRDVRYTRYLTSELMLRSHTSAMIPAALESLPTDVDDTVVSCPGLVYRRDVIDRRHVGEPHQLDLWYLCRHKKLSDADLTRLINAVVGTVLPGVRWRANPAVHPYTLSGREIEVDTPGGWVEVGECGLAHPDVLARNGCDGAHGLASGWGLDRLLMLRKGIDDIRLLRATDPRIAVQMTDLSPYEPVSVMPSAARDLSIAVDIDVDAELLGDKIRAALGSQARVVERVEILADTPAAQLPPAGRERLGLRADQRNVLVRVVMRDLERTLTACEANRLRDRIYAAIHQGTVSTWTSRAND